MYNLNQFVMIKRNLLGGALLVSVLFLFTGCKEIMSHLDNSVDSHLQVADKVTVIGVGKTYQIAKDVDYTTISDAGPTFESLDKTVATVDSKTGLVTALKSGDARIKISLPDNGLYLDASAIIIIKVRVQNTEQFNANVKLLAAEDQLLLDENAAIELSDTLDLTGKQINFEGAKGAKITCGERTPIQINGGFILSNVEIDASSLKDPLILMNKVPGFDPVESNQWVIKEPIKIDGVKVTGLTKNFFADSGKSYAYDTFTINNSIIQYKTQGNVVLNMAGSMAIHFNITNSTFYAKTAGSANMIALSGKRPWQITGYENETGKLICDHNTFYNMAKSKQFLNTNTLKGQKYLYEMNSNIFVDSSNKKIYGNMTNNTKQVTTDEKNTYWFDGAAFSETGYNGDAGLQTDPNFKDAANGDFTPQGTDQVTNKTGDPRWYK